MTSVIILGDKYQKGKKSKGCPGLIYQDKQTIIEHQINNIKKIIPDCKISYVCGFDGEKLKSFIEKNNLKDKINLIDNSKYKVFNESYSLSLALSSIQINSNVLVLSGYYIPLSTHFHNIDFSRSTLFIDNNKKTKLGCITNNNIVENIFFDLDNYIQDIYLIKNKDIQIIKQLLESSDKYNNSFLFEIINNIIDTGSIFYTHQLLKQNVKNYAKKKNSYI